MTEQKLKDYFENKISAEQLKHDLKDSHKKIGFDVTSVSIESINEGKFEIKKEHLFKLFDDIIKEKIPINELTTIGFSLMSSDFFYWENNTEEGERVAKVIFEIDNPEIGYDLTIKNILLWKIYLLSGEYRFDKNELNQKFSNTGKHIKLYLQIDEILWNDWDPIGINDIAPRDEYQSYTPIIFNLKIIGAGKETIAQKLNEIATQNMGLSSNIEHCRLIAEKIIYLEN